MDVAARLLLHLIRRLRRHLSLKGKAKKRPLGFCSERAFAIWFLLSEAALFNYRNNHFQAVSSVVWFVEMELVCCLCDYGISAIGVFLNVQTNSKFINVIIILVSFYFYRNN